MVNFDRRVGPGAHVYTIGPGMRPAISNNARGVHLQRTSKKRKKEATTTSAWEKILNASKSNDANPDRQGVEEQQMGPGTAPEDDGDSIATVLQEEIAGEVKSSSCKLVGDKPGHFGRSF